MALKLPSVSVNKTWTMLGIAIVLAILATFLTAQYLQNREASIAAELQAKNQQGGPKVNVVVPMRDLPVGTPLEENVVAGRAVAADLLYPGAITVDEFDAFKGQSLIKPVLKGRPLMRTDLRPMFADFAGSLEPGMRAMTIDVDELNSVSHMVQPGNRIDLMLAMRRDDGGQTVVPFMDRMKVLATGQKTLPDDDKGAGGGRKTYTYSTFTLEVTPTQAARLTLAQDLGKLRFTLRNEKDELTEDFSVNAQNIMDEVSQRARNSKRSGPSGSSGMVEFIVGGQRSGPNAKAIDVQAPSSVTPPAPAGTVVPPIAQAARPPAAGSTSGLDANGMTPEMKAELKNMLEK
jgi:pilus assembly protein CpaB